MLKSLITSEPLPNTETERQVMIADGLSAAAMCDVRANILRDHAADLRHYAQKLRREGHRKAAFHVEQAMSALIGTALEHTEQADAYRHSAQMLAEL